MLQIPNTSSGTTEVRTVYSEKKEPENVQESTSGVEKSSQVAQSALSHYNQKCFRWRVTKEPLVNRLGEICRGTFATIFKCKYPQIIAKITRFIDPEDKESFEKEVQTLAKCKDANVPFVIRPFDSFFSKSEGVLIMPHAGETLYKYKATPAQIEKIAYQILKALCGLNELSCAHYDIKPDNILIKGEEVRLIDFNLTEKVTLKGHIEIKTSLWYRAPEIVFRLANNTPADIWSFGCVLYELYTNEPLFPVQTETDMIWALMYRLGLEGFAPHIIEANIDLFDFDKDQGYLPNFKPTIEELPHFISVIQNRDIGMSRKKKRLFIDLLKSMLTILQTDRATAKELLKHPFFLPDDGEAEISSESDASSDESTSISGDLTDS